MSTHIKVYSVPDAGRSFPCIVTGDVMLAPRHKGPATSPRLCLPYMWPLHKGPLHNSPLIKWLTGWGGGVGASQFTCPSVAPEQVRPDAQGQRSLAVSGGEKVKTRSGRSWRSKWQNIWDHHRWAARAWVFSGGGLWTFSAGKRSIFVGLWGCQLPRETAKTWSHVAWLLVSLLRFCVCVFSCVCRTALSPSADYQPQMSPDTKCTPWPSGALSAAF